MHWRGFLLAMLLSCKEAYAFSPPRVFSIMKNTKAIQSNLNMIPLDTSIPESMLNYGPSTDMISMMISQEISTNNLPLIDTVLSASSFWSTLIMLTIISLLLLWENTIHTLRTTLPKILLTVLDSMLGEIGGIGFIGLLLQLVVTGDPDRGFGRILSEISEHYLGESDLLLESFEKLHDAFFEVGVTFFAVAGATVYAVFKRINELQDISKLALDTDGDGEVSLDELADALQVESIIVDLDGDGKLSEDEIRTALKKTKKRNFLEEMFLTKEERASEILLIRQRFIDQHNLSETFQIERYFERIFCQNLREIVELSPLTWLPLIPLLSLLNSIDLDNKVVYVTSPDAALACGVFFSSTWFLVASIITQGFGLYWCWANFWKMKEIKNFLIPALVKDGINGPATALPARYEDDELRMALNTSPGPMAFFERLFGGKEPTTNQEYLFGAAGENGIEFYQSSIKFHTWLCVSQIVFFLNEIVLRDIFALLDYNAGTLSVKSIGNLDALVPELIFYLAYVLLSIAQLSLAPNVFLNYCTATSIECMTQQWALDIAKKKSEERVMMQESKVTAN